MYICRRAGGKLRQRKRSEECSTSSATTRFTLITGWSTTLLSKVNLPHAINFGAVCGANLVTLLSKYRPNETFVLADRPPPHDPPIWGGAFM